MLLHAPACTPGHAHQRLRHHTRPAWGWTPGRPGRAEQLRLGGKVEPPPAAPGPQAACGGLSGPGRPGPCRQLGRAGPPSLRPHGPFWGPRAVPAPGRRAELVRPGLRPPRPGVPTRLAQGRARGQCSVAAALTKEEGHLGRPPPRVVGTRLRESLPPRGPPAPSPVSWPRAPLSVRLTETSMLEQSAWESKGGQVSPRQAGGAVAMETCASACQGRHLR